MAVIVEHVDVEAPIEDVWAQWTRFELFPQFMHAVENDEADSRERRRDRIALGSVLAGRPVTVVADAVPAGRPRVRHW